MKGKIIIMEERKIIEIIEFTDPVCIWCWGSEPLLRKLETRYKDQLKVKFIMGGLVPDIRNFYDSYNDIGGDAEGSNQQIVRHWAESSERHGMPVKSEGFSLFTNENPSTYPQNIAYKAAQMEDEELANTFLRRIREATLVEARKTNTTEVLIELANEVGLDIAKFIERFSDGSAEDGFRGDLDIVRKYGVRGFPTFLVKFGEKEVLLRGYQTFETINAVIKNVAGNTLEDISPEKSEENVLEFIRKYERVVPREIQDSFDYTKEEVKKVIESLKEKNLIQTIPAGNGILIALSKAPLSCDPVTGVCSI